MDPVWEELHAAREWGKYPATDLVAKVLRGFRGRDLSTLRALEIGCGAGANLSFLLREGFQVYGVDGAPSAIRKAGERLAGQVRPEQTLDLRVGDFERLTWPDASFDLVVDYMALYANRLKTIRAALAECRRVLKPGGYFFSRSWGEGCDGERSGTIVEPGTSENPTEGPCAGMGTSHFFGRAEWEELLAGFESRELTRVTHEGPGSRSVEWIVWARK